MIKTNYTVYIQDFLSYFILLKIIKLHWIMFSPRHKHIILKPMSTY